VAWRGVATTYGNRVAWRRHNVLQPPDEAGAATAVRILCCVKRVPMTGGRIVLTDDAQEIQTRHLGFTISPHEECAVEEAVRLVEAGHAAGNGGESVVLTLGPPEAEEQLRDCMAIGADRGILLRTDGSEWYAQSTAAAIVEAIRTAQLEDGSPFDLILFGNESADAGGYQVGIRVAHALGLPVVTGLKKIEPQDGRVRVERDVGGARDVYEAPLPAVLTVLEGLNLPRYPSVPGRLRAKSKPLAVSEPARPEQRLEKLRLVLPPGQGKQAEVLGEGPAAAPKVVELLQQLGVA
jgi:electron transfer flavoprotein beta subunit